MADYTTLSDRELAALLAEGSQGAFSEIYNRYSTLLFVYAVKKLHDQEEARDIVQEIFVSLWKNRSSHPLHTSLAAYLYQSVRNRAFDIFVHKQTEQRYMDALQSLLDEGESVTDDLIREKEVAALIERQIRALPPRMREVFELSRKQHLSHRAIADKLQISEQTVTKQVKKALKALRLRLGILLFMIWYLLA